MMELLYKQFNIDKNQFQQVIGVKHIPLFIGTTMQNLFLSLSQKDFIKNLLSPKTTVYLTIQHSDQ